jgi:hypothetical protein
MHLPRIYLCHIIFHASHYHLVISVHLLIFLIMFLALIKSVTIVPYQIPSFFTFLNFEI